MTDLKKKQAPEPKAAPKTGEQAPEAAPVAPAPEPKAAPAPRTTMGKNGTITNQIGGS